MDTESPRVGKDARAGKSTAADSTGSNRERPEIQANTAELIDLDDYRARRAQALRDQSISGEQRALDQMWFGDDEPPTGPGAA